MYFMVFDMLAECDAFFAYGTFKIFVLSVHPNFIIFQLRLVSRVHLLIGYQAFSLGKSFVTYITLIMFIVSVFYFMTHHVASLGESFVTYITLIRFFFSVGSFMGYHVAYVCKCFVTNIAFVGFSPVCSLLCLSKSHPSVNLWLQTTHL